MKRGLKHEAYKADEYPSKRVATDYGDGARPKRAVGSVDDLHQKLKAVELQALKFEHKAALMEQKNETLYAQLEKVILQNRVLRAGLGATFLQPETAPKVRRVALEESEGLAAKRFSWLTTKSYVLPHTVLQRICKCLCDDDLFRFREISLLFYTAYYEQVVKCTKFPSVDAFEFQYEGAAFNALRAVRLATRGRRFPNVEYMDVNRAEMPAELIMAICKYNFPRLSVLSLEFRLGSLRCLPGNPNLVALRVSIPQENDSEFVNQVRFPKLRQLRALNTPDDAAILIHPHHAIEFMELYCRVDWHGMQVGKKKFPKLKFLESEHAIPMMAKARLGKEGVELAGSS